MDAGNDRFNLMILCWNEAQSSAIHDHQDSHCIMKVLKGTLTEIKYKLPNETDPLISTLEPKCADIGIYRGDDEKLSEVYEKQMQEVSRTIMNTNDVCYINGKIF